MPVPVLSPSHHYVRPVQGTNWSSNCERSEFQNHHITFTENVNRAQIQLALNQGKIQWGKLRSKSAILSTKKNSQTLRMSHSGGIRARPKQLEGRVWSW